MGVLYDYFRAPDAKAAASAGERPGGPLHPDPAFDGVDAKGIDPRVVLGQLIALIRREPWQVDIVPRTEVWSDEEQGIDELGAEVRDVLAAVDDSRLPELGVAWARIEEFRNPDPEWIGSLVEQFVGLARRARDAGELLYCWSSL